jgi:hypothetical protein
VLEFSIELRPHIGEHRDQRLGVRTFRFPQSFLMYHDAEIEAARKSYWTEIGIVGDTTETIEFFPHALGLGQEVLDAVTRRVEEMTGTRRRQNLPPKPVGTRQRREVKELDAD